MLVDIKFQKDHQSASLEFKVSDFKDLLSKQECLATLSIIAADFYLDPELEISDLDQLIEQAKEGNKTSLVFFLAEDGLELELK